MQRCTDIGDVRTVDCTNSKLYAVVCPVQSDGKHACSSHRLALEKLVGNLIQNH